jgi:hypothetical protein
LRRIGLVVLLLALAGGGSLTASVLADDGPPTGSTDTTPTGTTTATVPTPTAPPPQPRPRPAARIAPGVTVGGVYVGGLSPQAAERVVRAAFEARLVLRIGDKRVEVSPERLGATAYVKPAIAHARSAKPGASIPLFVFVRGALVRSYVRSLAARYARTLVDADVWLRNLRPVITPGHAGLRIDRRATLVRILGALHQNRRGVLVVPSRVLRQTRTVSDFGPVIVIRRGSNALYLYRTTRFWRRFHVATGQSAYPTPIGKFDIVVKWRDPWWYPPPSPWAAGLKPVPPGPGNPLGTRWMGLSAPGVGIHGTPDAASIGYSASHGCIRMFIPDAEWLFNHVDIGTPVFIVSA